MKNLLALILSLALFAPPYAKLLLYADCSFKAMMNEDPRFCECSKIIDVAPYPTSDGQSEKQQNLEQKTDWKYLAQEKYQFQTSLHTTAASFQSKQKQPYSHPAPRICVSSSQAIGLPISKSYLSILINIR